jgi:nitrogen regulatory protein P-II 2
MPNTNIQLVTIIAEGLLRDRLIDDLTRLGARGYTIQGEVHGHGTRGVTERFWHGSQIRIESLVSAATADKLLHHLQEAYFADYSVVAYATDVRVMRPEKYV